MRLEMPTVVSGNEFAKSTGVLNERQLQNEESEYSAGSHWALAFTNLLLGETPCSMYQRGHSPSERIELSAFPICSCSLEVI
jgi:hypothetical protein